MKRVTLYLLIVASPLFGAVAAVGALVESQTTNVSDSQTAVFATETMMDGGDAELNPKVPLGNARPFVGEYELTAVQLDKVSTDSVVKHSIVASETVSSEAGNLVTRSGWQFYSRGSNRSESLFAAALVAEGEHVELNLVDASYSTIVYNKQVESEKGFPRTNTQLRAKDSDNVLLFDHEKVMSTGKTYRF